MLHKALRAQVPLHSSYDSFPNYLFFFYFLQSLPCMSGLFFFFFPLWPALTARNKITSDWQPADWSENSHLSHPAASCQMRYAKPCFRKFQYCQILWAAHVFSSIILEGKKTLVKYLSLFCFSFRVNKKKKSERWNFTEG